MKANSVQFAGSRQDHNVLVLLSVTLPLHFLSLGGNLCLFDFFVIPSLCYLFLVNRVSAIVARIGTRILLVYCFFGLLSVVSLFFYQGQSEVIPDFLVAHVKILWLIMYLVLALVLVDRCGFSRVNMTLALGIGVMNCVFIVLGEADIWQNSMKTRLTGPFHNPNIFGNFLCFSIFLSIAAFNKLSSMRARILYTGLVIVQVYGLLQSGSRGAVATLCVGFVLFGVFAAASAPKLLLKGIAICALMGALVVGLQLEGHIELAEINFVDRFTRTLDGEGPAVEERFVLWETAWMSFLERPFFGVGYGCYGVVAGDANYGIDGMVAHNTYLSYLVECGVLGSSFLMLVVVFGFIAVITSGWRDSASRSSWLYLPYIAGTAMQGFVANVDNYRALWISIGLFLAGIVVRDEETIK